MKAWITWALAVVLATIWAVAGIGKIQNPTGLAETIIGYRFLPHAFGIDEWLAALLALYLPWLEIVLAMALLWPAGRRTAAGLTAALLAAFTVVVAQAWARGIEMDCGCFDSWAAMSLPHALGRNLILLVFAIILWRLPVCAGGATRADQI